MHLILILTFKNITFIYGGSTQAEVRGQLEESASPNMYVPGIEHRWPGLITSVFTKH